MDKVKLKLIGEDGNAFSIIARFSQAAKRQGWSKEEVDKVIAEATSDDYDHLLQTIMANIDDEEI